MGDWQSPRLIYFVHNPSFSLLVDSPDPWILQVCVVITWWGSHKTALPFISYPCGGKDAGRNCEIPVFLVDDVILFLFYNVKSTGPQSMQP